MQKLISGFYPLYNTEVIGEEAEDDEKRLKMIFLEHSQLEYNFD